MIKELVKELNHASHMYYDENRPVMSDHEFDEKLKTLMEMLNAEGMTPEEAGLFTVGAPASGKLPKENHEFPAKSLAKTKSAGELKDWLSDKIGVLSWKLDGLTVVMTYDEGRLSKVVTRGDGNIGEVITHNARYFEGVPKEIAYKGHLVVRGEALISYPEFERINEGLDEPYENPRNLASGTVRALKSEVCKERHVTVQAFQLVYCDEEILTMTQSFEWLRRQGFLPVEYRIVDEKTLLDEISAFQKKIDSNDYPTDGLVLAYDDIEYGKALGETGHHPRHSMAFKWQDTTEEATVTGIEWSASKTGLLNPVAVFTPVRLEGTTVTRASLHNVSVCKKLGIGIGAKVSVYKANMIIPQVAEVTESGAPIDVPKHCPICGGNTRIMESTDGIQTLVCENPECAAKQSMKMVHFASRDAMNIDGISESKVKDLIDEGALKNLGDFYRIKDGAYNIADREGWGKKSYDNLIKAIEKSKDTTFERFVYSLSIPLVGRTASKLIAPVCDFDGERFLSTDPAAYEGIEGIGEKIVASIRAFQDDEASMNDARGVLSHITIRKPEIKEKPAGGKDLTGLTFVITGSLNGFANRDELKALIEDRGGKASGSVSKSTTALINNDIASTSGKNKKAKELGVEIISEKDFVERYLQDA